MAATLLLQTGCQCLKEHTFTGRLWDDEDLVNHYEPATDPNLKLFQPVMGAGDVLVVYDEGSEKNGHLTRRAYFLKASQRRVDERKKPVFVRLELTNSMTPIPIGQNGVATPAAPVWAELSTNAPGFILFRNGVAQDEYVLPTYIDKLSETKRVFLTPVAFTVDATIVGAVVGVFAAYFYAGCFSDAFYNQADEGCQQRF